MSKQDQYGINIKQFCARHEAQINAALSQGSVTPALLALHREKLSWLQHERLIHLIVVVLTSLAELFALDLTLLHPETHPGDAAAMLVLAILLSFYFAHYFFLENTTQHWYRLTEEMLSQLEKNSTSVEMGQVQLKSLSMWKEH